MKHVAVHTRGRKFQLLLQTRHVQAATMVLRPNAASNETTSNEHPTCEQWVYVLAGSGTARVGPRRSALRTIKVARGSLLVIEKGELHRIQNTGRDSMVLLTFYAPPAYDDDEQVRRSARR